MSDNEKERRISIENLPQAERELTDEESKEIQGGIIIANTEGDVHIVDKPRGLQVTTSNIDASNITGAGPGGGPHVKDS